MRLARMRDGLRFRWFGTLVEGDASGNGTDPGWSHLLDAVILLLRLPLRLLLDPQEALRWAVALIGPLGIGALAVACGWAVAPASTRRWAWTTAPAVALAPTVLAYSHLGSGQAEVPALAALAMAAGWVARAIDGRRRAGIGVGIWSAAAVWLDGGVAPIVLLVLGALAIDWLFRTYDEEASVPLCTGALSLVAVLGPAWLLDPPLDGYLSAQVGRLSVVDVAVGMLIVVVSLGLRLLDRVRLDPAIRAGLGFLYAVTAALICVSLVAIIKRGVAGPDVPGGVEAWLAAGSDMRPVGSLEEIVSLSFGAAFALTGICAVAFGHGSNRKAALWAYAGCCTGALAVFSVAHWRMSIYGQVAGAMMLPLLLTALGDGSRRLSSATRTYGRLATLAAILMVPDLATRSGQASEEARQGVPDPGCDIRDVLPASVPFGEAVILAEVNDGPELLYRSPLLTVATPFTAGTDHLKRAMEMWRSPPSRTQPVVFRDTGIRLILACKDRTSGDLGNRRPTAVTLEEQLNLGEIPA